MIIEKHGRLVASGWEVKPVPLKLCQELVEEYHYSKGGSNTRTYAHGLFIKGIDVCLGIAWWIPPTKHAAKASYPENWKKVLCLSRLVIVPNVPINAASFLLSKSRKLINREIWPVLITYADEWRGHTGQIYKADNWLYLGKTKPERVYSINGRMIARKAGGRTRTHAEMVSLGAVCLGKFPKHKYIHSVVNVPETR